MTAHTQSLKLEQLLKTVQNTTLSSFYSNRLSRSSEQSLKKLGDFPLLTWEDIITTTFLERIYVNEQMLVKLVRKTKPALIGRTLANIQQEPLLCNFERPLVLFESIGENLQWSTWFYKHNILSLLCEENEKLTALAAGKYEIDAIAADVLTLKRYFPFLKEYVDISKIKRICILDVKNNELIKEYFPRSAVSQYLYLPETGILAERENNQWIIADHIIAEKHSGKLVVTNTEILPTPIIRYVTELPISAVTHSGKYIQSFK